MRITSHPLRGAAAATAIRNSQVFHPTAPFHLRFITRNDAAFIAAISPGPSPASIRRWIEHDETLQAAGREFNFVIVANGRERGLVRMSDFAEIGGEASFGWGDVISSQPGLLTPTALAIYGLGFDTLGFARAHMTVPSSNPGLSAFHVQTGAQLEFDDGEHQYFRFGADAYVNFRNETLVKRA